MSMCKNGSGGRGGALMGPRYAVRSALLQRSTGSADAALAAESGLAPGAMTSPVTARAPWRPGARGAGPRPACIAVRLVEGRDLLRLLDEHKLRAGRAVCGRNRLAVMLGE